MRRAGNASAKSSHARARAKRLSMWRLGAPARRSGVARLEGFTSWLRLGGLGFPDEGEDLTMKVRELSSLLNVLGFGFPTAVGKGVTDMVRELPGWLDMPRLEFRKLDLVTEVRGPRMYSCMTEW